jgi:hypothetical protein
MTRQESKLMRAAIAFACGLITGTIVIFMVLVILGHSWRGW